VTVLDPCGWCKGASGYKPRSAAALGLNKACLTGISLQQLPQQSPLFALAVSAEAVLAWFIPAAQQEPASFVALVSFAGLAALASSA